MFSNARFPFRFQSASAYGIFGGRDVNGSVIGPDGHYDYGLQVVSLSYGYKF